MKYIYSTCTNGHVINGVTINGGHGLPNKHLWTPQGVLTQVTDEQYDAIKDHRIFKTLVDNGFFAVENRKVETEKVVKNMAKKDKSAQAESKDFKDTKAKAND